MKSSNIGGQAVMEGIMMRHGDVYSVAVRKPDKEIEVKVEDYKSLIKSKRIPGLPIIRGVFSFIDSLVVGTKCLMYSATFFEDEEEFEKRKQLTGQEKEREEADIVRRALNGEAVKQLAPVTAREDIIEMKKEIQGITVHDDIMDYAVEIARNTRKSRYLTLGASPRAAIALVRAARSRAYLEGRSFTTPEDVAALAQPVLLHRLILSAQARLEGKKEKDVLQEAMRAAKVPVL